MERLCVCGKCTDEEKNQYYRNVLQIEGADGKKMKIYGKEAAKKMKKELGPLANFAILAMAAGETIEVGGEKWTVIQEDCEEASRNQVLNEMVGQLE